MSEDLNTSSGAARPIAVHALYGAAIIGGAWILSSAIAVTSAPADRASLSLPAGHTITVVIQRPAGHDYPAPAMFCEPFDPQLICEGAEAQFSSPIGAQDSHGSLQDHQNPPAQSPPHTAPYGWPAWQGMQEAPALRSALREPWAEPWALWADIDGLGS